MLAIKVTTRRKASYVHQTSYAAHFSVEEPELPILVLLHFKHVRVAHRIPSWQLAAWPLHSILHNMSANDSTDDLLRRSALGAGLNDRHIESLAAMASRLEVSAGQILFSEGTAAVTVSVVCSGSVGLNMHVPVRGSIRILTLGPGDLLGWSAIVGEGVMTSTATALEDTGLLSFSRATLRDACEADHTLGYAVMSLVARSLAQRLRGTRLQMLDLFSETEPTQIQRSGQP